VDVLLIYLIDNSSISFFKGSDFSLQTLFNHDTENKKFYDFSSLQYIHQNKLFYVYFLFFILYMFYVFYEKWIMAMNDGFIYLFNIINNLLIYELANINLQREST